MKIVLTECSWFTTDVERKYLPKGAELIETNTTDEDELIETCKDADAALAEYAPFTRKVLENCKNLKIVANTAIGFDNIDIEAAKELGIAVANVPGYCAYDVADHTMALILSFMRNIVFYERNIRKGKWDIAEAPIMRRIAGKTLGLMGFGNIPQKVALRAQGFDMNVIAHDPYLPPETAEKLGVPLVGLEEVWEKSDVISCHTPLMPSTAGTVNAGLFNTAKNKPLFVNTSRGGVVNQKELVQALKDGKLCGAALDVMEPEPPDFNDEIFNLDNVIITPHAGFFSEEALYEVRSRSAMNVTNFLTGTYEKVTYVVKPEAIAWVEELEQNPQFCQ